MKARMPETNKVLELFCVQSCVKTFLLSFKNHSQKILLPTPKLHYGAKFQPAILETWQECFYTTLYIRLVAIIVL